MAVYLDYQSVYCRRGSWIFSLKAQVLAVCVLLAVLGFRVWIKVESTQLGYQLAQQRQLAVDLDMQRRELELHLSVMTRPDQLRSLADSRLGLRPFSAEQVRRISVSGGM